MIMVLSLFLFVFFFFSLLFLVAFTPSSSCGRDPFSGCHELASRGLRVGSQFRAYGSDPDIALYSDTLHLIALWDGVFVGWCV